MFWESVGNGLGVLTYWETYVVGLEYLVIFLVPTFFFGMATQTGGGSMGCLGMLLLPVLQVAAIAVFVLTLAPILFGIGDDATWSLPWRVIDTAPGLFFKLVGVLFVAALLLAFIPFFGQVQSLQTLVLGGIALVFTLQIVKAAIPELANVKVDLIPEFWFTVGLLTIGAAISWVGIMVAVSVATAIGSRAEGVSQLLVFPIAAVFGFIPVFIYGAWLGAQLKEGY
ncbi:MAG: hypothetical protein ACT4P0_10455 [Panacagrimonas sp.]